MTAFQRVWQMSTTVRTGTPDGGVTIDDLLYYLFVFEQGDLSADVDDGTASGTRTAA